VRLPPGYIDHDRVDHRIIAPRLALDEMIALLRPLGRDSALERERNERRDAQSGLGGRGGTRRVVLPGGRAVFVRKYIRGGFAHAVLRDLYLGYPERPVVELVVTETARAAGCPVPQVLAVCVEYALIGYRGSIVTEAIEGTRPLIDVYAERDAAGRQALLTEVGTAITGLHSAGVYHVDLNAHNVLVGAADRVSFVDFDRAFLGPPADAAHGAAARRRLWRSIEKLAGERGLALAAEGRQWLAMPAPASALKGQR
jgi:3-deoxy-D-manno-octulosonic acid kinase